MIDYYDPESEKIRRDEKKTISNNTYIAFPINALCSRCHNPQNSAP